MRQQRKRDMPRRLAALALGAAVLWVVFATAGSASLPAALEALEAEGGVAAALLRQALGDRGEDPWSRGPAALAIAQSPLLLGGRQAVLSLREQRETPEEEQEGPPQSPVEETPVDPEAPQEQRDNGVPAKTLVPTSGGDYLVSGLAYVNNTSDCEVAPEELAGDYARLGEGEPQVLIVHSHGSEAYTMPAGEEYEASGDYRTTDTNYNVVRVGDEIAAALAEAGISVVHDRSLNDYPNYSGAYGRSLEAVESYLEKYPSITFVLDVHRDAIADSEGNMYKVVSDTAEGRAAQMTLVMGSSGGGDSHDNWKTNLRLAVAVQNRLLEENPTLMRPITLRNSRYNQHCTPGSLLLEVGAAGNSLDEALLSARLFARGFAAAVRPQ